MNATSTTPTAAAPAARPGQPPIATQPRIATIVWGLVIAVIGAFVLAIGAGATLDLELVLISLLVVAGVALLAGSVAAAIRRRE